MADEADRAQQEQEAALEDAIRRAGFGVTWIPGEPGECCRCGEESPRLVNDTCARCRDKYKLG